MRGEGAAGINLGGGAGAIDREGVDTTVEPGKPRGERGVERAGRIDPDEAVDAAAGGAEVGERATDEVADGAVGHHLAGEGVDGEGGAVAGGGERGVEGAGGLAEFGDAVAERTTDAGEIAADDNAVGLNQNGADRAARGDGCGNPSAVVGTVGVEAGDTEARVAVDAGEFARDVDPVVVGGIDGDRGGIGIIDFDARCRGARAHHGRIVGDGGDDVDPHALRRDGGEAVADDDVVVAGVGERGSAQGQRGGDGPGER